MIRLGILKRLLIAVVMIVALSVPSVSPVSGQSSCRMACSMEKQTCHSCCGGDFSCGMSKNRSDAPHPLAATQLLVSWGNCSQAVVTRALLVVLPSTVKLLPDFAVQGLKHSGDTLTANCILMI
jgi:hypothetical protein